jgi:hypothetical protein
MYPNQADNEAISLIAEFLKHRKEDKGPHAVSNDIAAAQVCATLSVGYEISQLAKEAKEISLAIVAHAKAVDRLADSIHRHL